MDYRKNEIEIKQLNHQLQNTLSEWSAHRAKIRELYVVLSSEFESYMELSYESGATTQILEQMVAYVLRTKDLLKELNIQYEKSAQCVEIIKKILKNGLSNLKKLIGEFKKLANMFLYDTYYRWGLKPYQDYFSYVESGIDKLRKEVKKIKSTKEKLERELKHTNKIPQKELRKLYYIVIKSGESELEFARLLLEALKKTEGGVNQTNEMIRHPPALMGVQGPALFDNFLGLMELILNLRLILPVIEKEHVENKLTLPKYL